MGSGRRRRPSPPAPADSERRGANDPTAGLIGVILTNEAFTAAFPGPAAIRDFWTSAYAALAD
ncbi:MAG: hypothetical protein M3Q68_06565 [Actinomycetota bacterium]|nr:hypothetical protein [Actinomycetota bacterium]